MSAKAQSIKLKETENQEALLAQWQTCVEMANAVSERRDTMNNLFVTLNLAIIAAISFMWDTKTLALLIAGIIVCAVWILFIRNFRELNKAKFDVINKIESLLPVSVFDDEWTLLKKSKKYIEGTKLEKSFPIAFCCLYVAILMPNSPHGTHYMARISPEFLNRAGSKDHDRLMNLLPFRSLSFTGMKGLPGTYATILGSEDRSKELRQPRPSVREHLKQEPKQAAPKAPGHKKREPER